MLNYYNYFIWICWTMPVDYNFIKNAPNIGKNPDIYKFGYDRIPGDPVLKFTDSYLRKRGWCSEATIETNYIKNEYFYNISKIMSEENNWLFKNCIGKWDRIGRYYIEFEKNEDAVLFKLMFN